MPAEGSVGYDETALFFLYDVLIVLAALAAFPVYAFRALLKRVPSAAPWEDLAERLTWRLPRAEPGGVFVILSSVGEARAAEPFLKGFRERHPRVPLYLSAFTATGRAQARAAGVAEMTVLAPPLDVRFFARRVLGKLRPRTLVFIEGEAWPSLLREAKRAGAPTILMSGRMTEKALRRWRRTGAFARRVWSSLDTALMQSEADALRMKGLGVPAEQVSVTGSFKFDFAAAPADSLAPAARAAARNRVVLVAGSVRKNEEIFVLDAFASVKEEFPDALLFFAPRHPDKSESALAGERKRGRFRLLRFGEMTRHGAETPPCDVVWVDIFGALASLYALADAVFVGGSLLPYGGHNVLEPAFYGKAVVAGPHMEHFAGAAEALQKRGALFTVFSAASLSERWKKLLRHPEARLAAGRSAKAVLEENRGSVERSLDALAPYLEGGAKRA